MKIIVFSDSHRDLDHMRQAVEREQPDTVIHLGDHDTDAEQLGREYPQLPLICVRGNCDGWSDTPQTLTVVLGGVRFFLCHGHTYGVKASPLRAIYAARENKADILCFGHTHEALLDQTMDSPVVLNPGSCGYSYRPSYAVVQTLPGGHFDVFLRDCDGEALS